MLAAAGGGPIASGLDAVVARDSITHELISNLISAVEKVFAQHSEKAPRAHLSLFPSAVRAQDPSLKLQAHLFQLLLTGYSIFYGSSIAFPCERRAAIAIWHGTPSPPTPRLHTPTTTPPSPRP